MASNIEFPDEYCGLPGNELVVISKARLGELIELESFVEKARKSYYARECHHTGCSAFLMAERKMNLEYRCTDMRQCDECGYEFCDVHAAEGDLKLVPHPDGNRIDENYYLCQECILK